MIIISFKWCSVLSLHLFICGWLVVNGGGGGCWVSVIDFPGAANRKGRNLAIFSFDNTTEKNPGINIKLHGF